MGMRPPTPAGREMTDPSPEKEFPVKEESRWLTVADVAGQLGLDPCSVYRLCRARKIPHRRIGAGSGRIVFTPADVDAYLAACVVEVATSGPEEGPRPSPRASLEFFVPQGSPKGALPRRRIADARAPARGGRSAS